MCAGISLLSLRVSTLVSRAELYIANSSYALGGKLAQLKFGVSALVSSDNPSAVKPVLEQLIADKGTIRQVDSGFDVEAELEGESARDLNRMILSALLMATACARVGKRIVS